MGANPSEGLPTRAAAAAMVGANIVGFVCDIEFVVFGGKDLPPRNRKCPASHCLNFTAASRIKRVRIHIHIHIEPAINIVDNNRMLVCEVILFKQTSRLIGCQRRYGIWHCSI